MLRQPTDWRHLAAGALLLALLLLFAWRLTSRGAAPPTGVAPAGAQPRLRDAPEGPVAPAPR
jgi:hypothetical protein